MDRRSFITGSFAAGAVTVTGLPVLAHTPPSEEMLINEIRGVMHAILRFSEWEYNDLFTQNQVRTQMENYLNTQTGISDYRVFAKSENGIVMDVWLWLNDEFYLLNTVYDQEGLRNQTIKIDRKPKIFI